MILIWGHNYIITYPWNEITYNIWISGCNMIGIEHDDFCGPCFLWITNNSFVWFYWKLIFLGKWISAIVSAWKFYYLVKPLSDRIHNEVCSYPDWNHKDSFKCKTLKLFEWNKSLLIITVIPSFHLFFDADCHGFQLSVFDVQSSS